MKQEMGGIEVYNELLKLHSFVQGWVNHLEYRTKKRKEIIDEMQEVLNELDKKLKKSAKK